MRDVPELFHQVEHLEGRHATIEDLALVHDESYVRSIEAISASGGGQLDTDTVASEGSWLAATAAAGCVLDGVDYAVSGAHKRSFCAVRPPGHHALRSRAMGFCIFGSVACAAHYARQRHGLKRVLILDWDVHHGNGTQALVENEPDIHFVSMHRWPWYPGTGAAEDRGPHESVWNVPMPPALPASDYLSALDRAIDSATKSFVPDIILVSSGFDSLAGDPIGGFTLEMDDVEVLTRSLAARADAWCEGRLVSALEGGYLPERLGEGAVRHLAALA